MVIEKRPWFPTVFRLQGSVIPTIFPRVLLCSSFSCLVSLLYAWDVPVVWPVLGSFVPNVVSNLVLGLLLVFRTNTAYERYWEGRKCWGGLVVTVRNLARQIRVAIAELEPADREAKLAVLRLLGAFAIATKLHLRQEPPNDELTHLVNSSQLKKLQAVKIPPLEIALWIGDYLQQQHQQGRLNADQLIAMNNLLNSLVEALTGCERILRTPIPLAYAIHLKQLLLIYCLSLPFQLVDDLHWWTAAVVALISFTLLGIEAIGIEIENPFGHDPNDLPLDEICTTMLTHLEDLIPLAAGDPAYICSWKIAPAEQLTD